MNGDNALADMREGLIRVRAMLGFSGATVIDGTSLSQPSCDATRPQINALCGIHFAP
jgi:hypothetical protein